MLGIRNPRIHRDLLPSFLGPSPIPVHSHSLRSSSPHLDRRLFSGPRISFQTSCYLSVCRRFTVDTVGSPLHRCHSATLDTASGDRTLRTMRRQRLTSYLQFLLLISMSQNRTVEQTWWYIETLQVFCISRSIWLNSIRGTVGRGRDVADPFNNTVDIAFSAAPTLSNYTSRVGKLAMSSIILFL